MHSSPVPAEIRESMDFWPYFKDCIGAIDGSHIPAFVPESMQTRFRNRKGQVSQNVLTACSMNMEFLYVLPRWEGSAADSHIFENVQREDFRIPNGCYYLADARYGNSDGLMVLYRGVRYHLKEWGSSANRQALIHSHSNGMMRLYCIDPKTTRSCSITSMHGFAMSSSTYLALSSDISRFS
jgi:hypothetical protein